MSQKSLAHAQFLRVKYTARNRTLACCELKQRNHFRDRYQIRPAQQVQTRSADASKRENRAKYTTLS